ncbi:MAG: hypothetical protein QME64_01830, partial [bacterium]|nr:hypothetical protein [bacterium]
NYYKNTRGKGVPQDNKGFFAIEQIAASATLVLVCGVILLIPNPTIAQIVLFQSAFTNPTAYWHWEITSGFLFGVIAFFSVFLFMFKGRTATFAGLSNRLTSLVAGTASTVIFWFVFKGKFPKPEDWISLIFIFIAVGFLTHAEMKRIAELKAAKELA